MELLLMCGILLATFHTSYSNMPEFCQLPMDGGTGPEIIQSVYYDAANDNCFPFIYKGQGGNQNRFNKEKECMRTCSANAEAFYPIDEREACHLSLLKGSCGEKSVRFYYDSINDFCRPFIWKGCIGNGNRFLTSQTCNDTCNGIHDDGVFEGGDEKDTPVALICMIVFGITTLILVIVVIVLMVKSRNTPKTGTKTDKREETALRERAIEME